jgi:uncharacterized membrane protein YciS (DUF1049 family)
VLLIVAVALLIIGAANNDQRVDLDYIFGTWHQVSLFTLIAIAAAALVVVGLTAAAFEAIGAAGDRRKLERELEQTYGRLRESEAHAAQLAEEAAAAASREEVPVGVVAGTSSGAVVADGAAGPDDGAAGPDDAAAERYDGTSGPDDAARSDAAAAGSGFDDTGPDDRTRAFHHQPGRDDT